MPRFSLSPAPSQDENDEEDLQGVSFLHDNGDDDSTEEEEPAHPLGFGSSPYGRTWFGLEEEPVSFQSPGRNRYGLFEDDEDESLFSPLKRQVQSYPPLSKYLDARTAPTQLLLKYAPRMEMGERKVTHYEEEKENEPVDDMERLAQMLQASHLSTIQSISLPEPELSAKSSIPQESSSSSSVATIRAQLHQEHLQAQETLKALLEESDRKAATILKQKQALEAEERAEQEKQDQADEKARQQEQAAAEQARREKEQQAHQDAKVAQAQAAERKKKEEAAAKETEYIAKAKKLVGQLVQVRASVKPFEESKAVSKRRLKMKKIAGGKLNTLTEEVSKVHAVAVEVGQAISEARREDEDIKQRLQQGDTSVSQELTRGKRYFLDLLGSNVIKRVQADGFTGTRGDGFPLAGMLAVLSLQNKDFVPILAAHIYTVCPTAIPTLPSSSNDLSEDDFMSSLGMLKEKDGEFESFPKFLQRTENIISLMANIQASNPEGHTLMGGSRAAMEWLNRFLALLPEAPVSPLPLITAPVLVAFLTGAGHMLANKYPDEFRKCLTEIETDIVMRVDEGEIGKPSQTRLAKLLEGSFDKFKNTLPSRALPELYNGTSDTAEQQGKKDSYQASKTASASSNNSGNAPNPFGGGGGMSQSSPFGNPSGNTASPFSGNSMPAKNPFGGGPTSMDSGSSAFGQGSFSSANNSSPFGTQSGSTNASPFGQTNQANPMSTSNSMNSNSAFGGGQQSAFSNQSNPTPFGSPFGTQSGSTTNASPFGQTNQANPMSTSNSMNNNSAFGGGQQSAFSNQSNPSPFGSNANPSPFGGGMGNTNPSPFGGGMTSPFGGGSNTGGFSNASPFGGGRGGGNNNNRQNNSGRGGGGGRGGGKQICKYFHKGNCRFGNNCKFSHDTGGGNNNYNNRGGGGFGGGFGGGNTSGFGQSSNNNSTFGNAPNPFGGGGGGGGFGSSMSSPFGAPRR